MPMGEGLINMHKIRIRACRAAGRSAMVFVVIKPPPPMSHAITPPSRLALKYIYGSVVRYRPGDKLAPRVLSDYELVLMIEGTANYRLNGVDHKVPPGGMILARPGFRETYTWDSSVETRHAYVHFDIATLPADWPPVGKWPFLFVDPDPVVAPMLRHLLGRIAAHGKKNWPTMRAWPEESLFLEFLMSILLKPAVKKGHAVGDRLPEQVHASLNYMRAILDANPHHALQLGELSKRAGVTEKHLCRIFRNSLGHAPMETFRLLKLQLAMALLGRSSLAIKEIADRCGFENPLYFTRCFTRLYGQSPTQVRRSLLRQKSPPQNPLPPDIAPRIYW